MSKQAYEYIKEITTRGGIRKPVKDFEPVPYTSYKCDFCGVETKAVAVSENKALPRHWNIVEESAHMCGRCIEKRRV